MPCERKHIEAIKRAHGRVHFYQSLNVPGAIEDLTAAINEALAACDESQWRGMDSAPRDGNPVDLWGNNGERTADCHWNYSRKAWTYWGTTDYGDPAWVRIKFIPTHWMPLPEAPEAGR